MRGLPDDFWGKLERDGAAQVTSWHPLEAHCADVAACTETLLRDTLLGARLARLAGLDRLDEVLVARLAALAALHDLGKFSVGFQNRPFPERSLQGGHVEPIVKALSIDGAVRRRILEILAPLGVFGDLWPSYLAASISHHGRPEKIGDAGPSSGFDPLVFAPAHGLDPLEGMRRLVARVQGWWPRAFGRDGLRLPESPPAAHFFAGVVMLADWLGSDADVFAHAEDREDPMLRARGRADAVVRDRFLDVRRLRKATRTDFDVFAAAGGRFVPRPAQAALDSIAVPSGSQGSLVVLESETGSGKTEASVHRFAQLFAAGVVDGLYFALPTRTAATQIHDRVVRAVASTFDAVSPADRPPVVLAVPGYLRVDAADGTALPGFQFLWPDDDRAGTRHRTWAAEHPKRFLAGSVVVGTIDQVLLSTLVVSHAHLRATSLSRLLLVVDEVHASDAYMTALLDHVLAFHLAAGGHALLMSATLGTTATARFFARTLSSNPLSVVPRVPLAPLDDAIRLPYPAVHHAMVGGTTATITVESPAAPKSCEVELWPASEDPDAVASRALDAAREGATVLVLRNTVSDAIATQLALEARVGERDGPLLFQVNDIRTLHHARFGEADRRLLDGAIELRLGKDAPRGLGAVVVATQTVQQSLDLDADFLLTDLCPMDVLLQRIGRLHRHTRRAEERPAPFRIPRCVVLDPGPLEALVGDDGVARGRHGLGRVYEDLRVVEATRRMLLARTRLVIPRDNRELVERTTHDEALEAIARASGPRMVAHGLKVAGVTIARLQHARGHVVERHEVMGRYGFPSLEVAQRITTRLGEADRLVELRESATSVFGTRFRSLKIPHWMTHGLPSQVVSEAERVGDVCVVTCRGSDGAVAGRFDYDRLGLRVHGEAQSIKEADADD